MIHICNSFEVLVLSYTINLLCEPVKIPQTVGTFCPDNVSITILSLPSQLLAISEGCINSTFSKSSLIEQMLLIVNPDSFGIKSYVNVPGVVNDDGFCMYVPF